MEWESFSDCAFSWSLPTCTFSRIKIKLRSFKKVQEGNDQEKEQSEKDSHSKNRGEHIAEKGDSQYRGIGYWTCSEQAFLYSWISQMTSRRKYSSWSCDLGQSKDAMTAGINVIRID